MKRLISLLLLAGLVAGLSTRAYAAFGSVSKSTFTAQMVFSGTGVVNFYLELKDLNVGTGAIGSAETNINWDNSSITAGSTGWTVASTVVVLHSTMTAATGGLQIYTDNLAADATQYTGILNPAGLVGADHVNGDLTASSSTLSMCWRIVDTSTNTLAITEVSSADTWTDPDGDDASNDGGAITKKTLYATGIGLSYPCYFALKDKGTPDIWYQNTDDFDNGEDYSIIKEQARGIHHAEGANWGTTASPDYIYLGADFRQAVTPRTYRANIRLEAFTE